MNARLGERLRTVPTAAPVVYAVRSLARARRRSKFPMDRSIGDRAPKSRSRDVFDRHHSRLDAVVLSDALAKTGCSACHCGVRRGAIEKESSQRREQKRR
jgi:hypothetical protein